MSATEVSRLEELQTAYRRARLGAWTFTLFRAGVIVLYLAFILVPLAWLFVNSVKLPREWLSKPPVIVPSEITWDNYTGLFASPYSDAPLALQNSIIVTVVATIVSVLVGSLAAYSFVNLRWRFIPAVSVAVLVFGLYPKITTVIPYYVMVNELRLLDTLVPIIVAFVGLVLPQTVWLMMIFFAQIPVEIEQSAMLDGCGPWKRFFMIVLPLAKPGIAVAAIMSAMLCWVEFMIASSLVVVNAKTLPVAVSAFLQDKGLEWGPMSALAMVTVIPVVVFGLFIQRYLVRGLTMGAVRG